MPKLSTPTIALEYCSKELQIDNKIKVKAQIWDTGNILYIININDININFLAGQDKYKSLTAK